jgi:glycine reductase
MRLEHRVLNIKGVQFDTQTAIKNSVLHINQEELRDLLQEDKRFGEVQIEIARPSESCRILQVADVIEPRAKTDGSSEDFPGAMGKQGIAGEGVTYVLRNVAVVTNDQSNVGSKGPYMPGKILDMAGPAAGLSRYSDKHIVAVLPSPREGVSMDDYRIALKLAGLKTAVHLARAGRETTPDETEVYDLPSPAEASKGMEGLPRVAYIFLLYMNQLEEIKGEPILYGDNIRHLLPTIIHPNEIIDGAIVNPYRGGVNDTYAIQNHAVIKELAARHGKDLFFAGVILTISHSTEPARERAVAMCAKLAKHVLSADGVIVTKSFGGAPEVDMGQTATKCEELGIDTSVLMWQMTSTEAGGPLFNQEKINAITTTANLAGPMMLPPVERVIGIEGTLPTGQSVSEKFMKLKWDIVGGIDQLGGSRLGSIEY